MLDFEEKESSPKPFKIDTSIHRDEIVLTLSEKLRIHSSHTRIDDLSMKRVRDLGG